MLLRFCAHALNEYLVMHVGSDYVSRYNIFCDWASNEFTVLLVGSDGKIRFRACGILIRQDIFGQYAALCLFLMLID